MAHTDQSATSTQDSLANSSFEATVIIEFCRAGLWPGASASIGEALIHAGVSRRGEITEQRLATLPKVTDKRARRLFSSWIAAQDPFEVSTILLAHQLPIRWSRRLCDLLGVGAASVLTADPWQLLAIGEATLAQADRLARSIDPTASPADSRRLRALALRVLTDIGKDGHTASPIDILNHGLAGYGVTDMASQANALTAASDAGLIRIVDDPAETTEQWVAVATVAAAEETVARRLLSLDEHANTLASQKSITQATGGLDTHQTHAIEAVATRGVSMLTGGPGTGKSRTVAALVSLCADQGLTLALAAPTGRAAKRLTELATAASPDAAPQGDTVAVTIHRLLGARARPGGAGSIFEHDADNPLEADVIVVDEASMMDVELAAALVTAIPDDSHLMIVGDPAQLPPIGMGKVLADMLAAAVFPVTELTTLYRQHEGGAIARLATAVRDGHLIAPTDDGHEAVIVPAADAEEASRRVVQLVTDSIPRVFGAQGEDIQVITPIHRGPAGTKALNLALKDVLNPGRGTVRGFDVGDRVVATANYADAEPTGYANGEVGTVTATEGRSIRVEFPGGEASIKGKALSDLLHGWAITVHRAQGSEWDAVVLVLPLQADRMLSRPLIYTGLTRARRHLSVVHAAGRAVAYAVKNVGARPRRTRLQALLRRSDAAATPSS